MNKKIKIVAAAAVTASLLTSCKMPDFIEDAVNPVLTDENEEISHELMGMPVYEGPVEDSEIPSPKDFENDEFTTENDINNDDKFVNVDPVK